MKLVGTVTSVVIYSNPVRFTVKSKEETYQCYCPFFKPIQEGDCIVGQVKKVDQQYEFIQDPYVFIPHDKGNLLQLFIKAFRGHSFGLIKANKLHDDLSSIVSVDRLIKMIPKLGETAKAQVEFNPDQDLFDYIGNMAHLYKINPSEIASYLSSKSSLSKDQVGKLLEWWHKSVLIRRLYLLGLNNSEIRESNKKPDQIHNYCTKLMNPYVIASIPIEKCTNILRMLGYSPTEDNLYCGSIVRKVYNDCKLSGWTCTPISSIIRKFPLIDMTKMREEYQCHFDLDSIYLNYQYLVETSVAKYLNQLIESTATQISDRLEDSSYYFCKTLTPEQKEAIHGALTYDISIITGGGGTGKSTLANELVKNLELRKIPYMIGSFTGKAVARLNSIIDSKVASTLDMSITKADGYPLAHLIIDEISMVTTELLYRFINTFKGKFKITMIGDKDQLQPVSWGGLFNQLLLCGRIPVFRLNQNHRILQDDSVILRNANQLFKPGRNYKVPVKFEQGNGFVQLDGGVETIETIITQMKKLGMGLESLMILSPYNEYTTSINQIVDKVYLSDNQNYTDLNGINWCVGGRVMMLSNNYSIGIMNGEEGEITAVDLNGVECVFKDGIKRLFKYKQIGSKFDDDDKEINTLMICKSFAITVHKSQGSEQECVIIYIPHRYNSKGTTDSTFLSINVLYTALTRARKQVFLIGSPTMINQATCQLQPKRCENLSLRLKAMANPEKEVGIKKIIDDQIENYRKSIGVDQVDQLVDDYDDDDGECHVMYDFDD